MNIIFYSTDTSVKHFFESIDVANSYLYTTFEEVEKHFASDEHIIIFLDFDCEELNCKSVSSKLNKVNNVNTVLISKDMNLKEILDFQSSESGCDAYITKPLTTEILTGVINDFEIAIHSINDNSESVETDIDLTFIGIKRDLLEQLKSSSDDNAEEESPEDEDEEEFHHTEMGVASEVREIIDSHRSTGVGFESVVNDEIQRKFDTVFGVNKSTENIEVDSGAQYEEVFTEEDKGLEESKDEEENKSIIFDIDSTGTEEDLDLAQVVDEVLVSEAGSLAEVNMSEEKNEDVGLEFNIPENINTEPEENTVDGDLVFEESQDSDGLEFKLGDSEDDDTLNEGLDSDDLSFSDDKDKEEDSLDLTSDEDNQAFEEEEDSGISFDDDVDEELDLSESYDAEDAAGSGDSEDQISEEIEATISSIVAPLSMDDNSTGEFDVSGLKDQPQVVEEFDYKTASALSMGNIDDDSSDEIGELGEDTNPTIVANTSTLSSSEFMGKEVEDEDLDEIEDDTEDTFGIDINTNNDIEEENDYEDIAFGNEEDLSAKDESHLEEDNLNETLTVKSSVDEREELKSTPTSYSSSDVEVGPRSYDEDEMLRLQGTIRQLREERESLMANINSLTSEKQLYTQDNLGLKAELDELKIELEIVKKRNQDEINELKHQVSLSLEKKDVYEMKYKALNKEFERLNQKVRIDFNQVKQREKELESKLELVVMDSDSQVQSRDMKILDLKRKIDSLEFNMENSSIREQKHRDDKSKLEERLAKIMKTLRGSIQLIEDDLDVIETDNTTELDNEIE